MKTHTRNQPVGRDRAGDGKSRGVGGWQWTTARARGCLVNLEVEQQFAGARAVAARMFPSRSERQMSAAGVALAEQGGVQRT